LACRMFHQKITYPDTLQSRTLSIPCHHLLLID
jgi:hypothetical protein